MPRVFAITAASNTVHINGQRQGEASFTVTNTSGTPIRGRANIVVSGDTKESWFSVCDNAERDFNDEETQQFTVKIVVPESVKQGNYHFSIDLVSVENPDEDYVGGPSVSFNVEEALMVVNEKTWCQKYCKIVAFISLTILVAIIAVKMLSGNKIPDVAMMPINAAIEALEKEGYNVGAHKYVFSDKVPGLVLQTEPVAQSDLDVGGVVILIVSKENVFVPDVTMKSASRAKRELLVKGFKVGVYKYEFSNKSPGLVLRTEPVAQSDIETGGTIILIVSKKKAATGQRPLGKRCTKSSQCVSKFCSSGICKMPVNTGWQLLREQEMRISR